LFTKKTARLFVPIIIVALTLAASHVVALVSKNEDVRIAYFDIGPAVINALATAMLVWAAIRTREYSKRVSFAWAMFASAQFLYTCGDVLWMVDELFLNISPYPSLADAFYLANYPFFLIGTFFLTNERHSRIENIKHSLDMLITLAAAILGIWYFLVQPIISQGINDSHFLLFLTVAYPVGDIVLFAALVWLINHDTKRFSTIPVLLLFGGIFFTIVFDTIYSYQAFVGTYEGGKYLDIGWILSYLVIGLAGYHQALFPDPDRLPEKQNKLADKFQTNFGKVVPYLPYAWMIFAYFLLFKGTGLVQSNVFITLYTGVGLIIVLVILRQFIALYENSKLNMRLLKALDSVQQQTQRLETTNLELEAEIQSRMKVEMRLSYDALHDSLTDLPNRVFFLEKLKEAIEESKSVIEHTYSVLYMDIDQFKVINDSLGHHIGDELLKILSSRLKRCMRSTDAIARLGGDEFVFLIENVPSENAIDFIVNRIQAELANVILLDGHPIFITTSIGVVWNLRGYESPENILRDADLAMYHAKRMGKDRFEVFHEGLRLQAISRLEIEENLRNAVKNGELELYYQPIMQLEDNELAGFEALIRWNNPQYGVVYPNEFLPVAEETGLAQSIGRWCLTTACNQARDLREKWPQIKDCYFSVNVSGKQLAGNDFVSHVRRILHETKVSPETLRMEITESTLIEYNEEIKEKFTQLGELGIKLSIDDFGTGYSSLAYLKDFPVNSLKIDQSFVREIGVVKSSTDLIKTMISMGQDLGLDVIAEGIESPQQLSELIRLTCKYGQGFMLSLPLRVESLEELLRVRSFSAVI
jgi:diguanylate cyclase (GGDEF)-like protein